MWVANIVSIDSRLLGILALGPISPLRSRNSTPALYIARPRPKSPASTFAPRTAVSSNRLIDSVRRPLKNVFSQRRGSSAQSRHESAPGARR